MARKGNGSSAGLVMVALGAACPAQAQFMTGYPAVIVVPPPAQNYAVPKRAGQPAAPDKLKAFVDDPDPAPTQRYQGRTLIR